MAMQQMEEDTVQVGDWYVVPMLWKSPDTTLPENSAQALKQFSLEDL